jgi:acetolactate synthase regulatory subunit
MPLPEDWRVFTELLNSNAVDYVVVGAIALAHHGFPRYTGDLDILIRNTPENARRLEGVLREFGFDALGLKATDFIDSHRVIQLGVPPNRIDLLTSITGVAFDEAWASREKADLGGVRVNIIDRQSLIKNKRATGRSQDLADLRSLGAES